MNKGSMHKDILLRLPLELLTNADSDVFPGDKTTGWLCILLASECYSPFS